MDADDSVDVAPGQAPVNTMGQVYSNAQGGPLMAENEALNAAGHDGGDTNLTYSVTPSRRVSSPGSCGRFLEPLAPFPSWLFARRPPLFRKALRITL